MMKLFNKVAIVGTGLIGGSMGLEIKRKGLAKEVVGVSRHKKNLLLAKQKGAIDRGSRDLGILKHADLVILATPVNAIINLAPRISRIVSRDCVVTDVGSTKEEIVKSLQGLFPNFVGAHPLAGSEKRSIAYAQRDLFKDSLCIITVTQHTKPKALNLMKALWSKMGARTVLLSPVVHDRILSFVSHLPHAAAFSLIGCVPQKYLKFASAGLKDATRVAGSDSELWVDIFLSNRKNILKAIGALEGNLSRIKSAIRRKDRKLLNAILRQAKDKRNRI